MALPSAFTSTGVLLCGHRGHSVGAPENTLAALRAAAEAGAAACEIDVRRTGDGTFVLMHDRTVDRTTNGAGLVGRMTLREVCDLDAGAWFSDAFRGEAVPTFESALAFARERGSGLIAEIKDQAADDRWLRDFADLIAASGMSHRCFVSSFDHTRLARLKELRWELATVGIAHVRVADAARLVRNADLDALILEYVWHDVDDVHALAEAATSIGLSVPRPAMFDLHETYGAPDLARFDDMLASGLIDILIGDDVAWLRAQVARVGLLSEGSLKSTNSMKLFL